MSTLNEKITNVADGVRTLSATTSGLTLDQMASNVEAANSEITNQSELISQIMTALEGKAAGGASIETCTVTINHNSGSLYSVVATKYENGQIIGCFENLGTVHSTTVLNVVKGSIISFETTPVIVSAYSATSGITETGYSFDSYGLWSFAIASTVPDNVEITVWDDD